MSADTDPTPTSEKPGAPSSAGPAPPIARLSRMRERSVAALAILLLMLLGVVVGAGIVGRARPVPVGMAPPPGPAAQAPGTAPSTAPQSSGGAPAQPVTPGAAPTVPDYMKPDVEPWNEPPASQAGLKVPLRAGLTVVTAVATPDGDYESIKRITTVTDDAVTLTQSADVPAWVTVSKDKAIKVIKHIVSKRKVLREDMRKSHYYQQVFTESAPEVLPGTTAITTSAAVLEELKQKGEVWMTYGDPDPLNGPPTTLLRRVEPRPVPFQVLLNNRRVELPALHAKSPVNNKGFSEEEFYFLNDSENPIVLAWQLSKEIGKLQVIKISVASEGPSSIAGAGGPPPSGGGGGGSGASPGTGPAGGAGGAAPAGGASGTLPGTEGQVIRQSLQQTGRAEVYGIYFEFAKATIREESEPVLKAIADLLTQHPGWMLSVEGHTDNIGTEAYNLDLSNRRAAAVKQALVERYHIAANRLTTMGYGASRSKESNETLAGRARNRRVELVRH